MKSSLSSSPEEKLFVGKDPDNPNGNFSDIFVCHGKLAVLRYSLRLSLTSCPLPFFPFDCLCHRKCDSLLCNARLAAASRSLVAHCCVQRVHHCDTYLPQRTSEFVQSGGCGSLAPEQDYLQLSLFLLLC